MFNKPKTATPGYDDSVLHEPYYSPTLRNLLRALPEMYPSDSKTHPGVTLAYVPDKGFYASVCRYGGFGGRDKTVVCAEFGESFGIAITKLANTWTEQVQAPAPTYFGRLKNSLRRGAA